MREQEVNLSAHMPVLDGIRGLAIIAVLIFHTTILRPSGPIDNWYNKFGLSLWIGVDLFFVLSGFLITGILYDAKGTKRYFRKFYARRTLRIFPLYFLVVGVAVFILPKVSSYFPKLGADQWWYWTYLSNYLIAQKGLGHLVLGPTWSLAIEEQFYIVWPVLVFLFSRKIMMWFCVFIIVGAVVLRWWLLDAGAHHNLIYVSTYTRMDTLAIGGFLALCARGPNRISGMFPWIWAPFLASGMATLYFLAHGLINKKLPEMIEYGYFTVAIFFGTSIVIALTRPVSGLIYKVFTNKLLVFYGKYSYAIYLFNRPFVNIVADNWFKPNQILRGYGTSIPGQLIFSLTVIMIATILAVISWHAFEKHFLSLKKKFEK